MIEASKSRAKNLCFAKGTSSFLSFPTCPNSLLSTWLYKIVYYTSITKLNSTRKDNVELNEETGASGYILDEKREVAGLLQADRKKYINLALAQLVEEERIVITLHYLVQKSISEIAEILGLGKSAIKMRLMRGRKKLEELLSIILNEELKDLL